MLSPDVEIRMLKFTGKKGVVTESGKKEYGGKTLRNMTMQKRELKSNCRGKREVPVDNCLQKKGFKKWQSYFFIFLLFS